MANINPRGTDLTTGQERPIAPTDTLTDSGGNILSGGFSISASQVTGTSLAVVIPANTIAIGDVLYIEALVDLTPTFFSATDLDFGGTSILLTPAWNGNTDAGVIMKARVQRTATGNWASFTQATHFPGPSASAPTLLALVLFDQTDDFSATITITCSQSSGALDVISLKAWLV